MSDLCSKLNSSSEYALLSDLTSVILPCEGVKQRTHQDQVDQSLIVKPSLLTF